MKSFNISSYLVSTAGAESFQHWEWMYRPNSGTAKAIVSDVWFHWEVLYFPSVPSKIKGLSETFWWSKSLPEKVYVLKYIFFLSTFLQHEMRSSACSTCCQFFLAGAWRGTPPDTSTPIISISLTNLLAVLTPWTPHFAELLPSVLQPELFVAMQEQSVDGQLIFFKPY